jgi:hypothetical protein
MAARTKPTATARKGASRMQRNPRKPSQAFIPPAQPIPGDEPAASGPKTGTSKLKVVDQCEPDCKDCSMEKWCR